MIDDAAAIGADADAISAALRRVAEVSAERSDSRWDFVLQHVAFYSHICGAERLVTALVQEMQRGRVSGRNLSLWLLGATTEACADASTGHGNAFRSAAEWCLRALQSQGLLDSEAMMALHDRLRRLRLDAEAREITRSFVNWRARQPGVREYEWLAVQFVRGDTDPRTRRLLTEWSCPGFLASDTGSPRTTVADLVRCLSGIQGWAPVEERVVWAFETGLALADVAPLLPKIAQRTEAPEGAAKLFEVGDRKDLAEQCRELAKALSANDPKALLNCSLTATQSAAGEGRWDDVSKTLEPAIAKQEPSVPLLQATLLLQYAYRKTGKGPQAEDALDKAGKLLGQVTVSSAERANYAIAMASGTDDRTRKTFFLQAAQEAARVPGLEFLQEGIAAQLADAALASGDMAAAQKALTDIVERNEAKRGRLAFDPLLRQQWFADNIGPYRKLMRVAATRGDANLALQAAQKKLIGAEGTRHPFFWAGFIAVRGPQ